MSSIPSNLWRVSTSLSGEMLMSNLRRSNVELLRIQSQISSGKRIMRPSDEPHSVGAIGSLRTILGKFQGQLATLSHAASVAQVTDHAMSDVSDLLLQARNVALSQIGITATAQTRAAESAVVQGMIDGLMQVINREHNGVYLFAGDRSNVRPFAEHPLGTRYVGGRDNLLAAFGGPYPLEVNANGGEALGALSSRVMSLVDLNPQATAGTRLSDVQGARGLPVSLGVVTLTVNGASIEVDLAGTHTLGDVATRINTAINALDPAAGSVAVGGDGFVLTANAGHTVQVADVGNGVTAGDLGLRVSAAGASVAGEDINPFLTHITQVADLGVAIDWAGGLKITNGTLTRVVDFSGAASVEDMINAVAAADLGVRLEINRERNALNLVNEISGTSMSVGENAGGTTATDLGLRSFAGSTLLADFNYGQGVRLTAGADDLRIQLGDGTMVDINLDGARTVQDVLDILNAAGAPLTASLASDGNGIVLSDTSGGAIAPFKVMSLNTGYAAADLGIAQNVGNATTINGEDTATARTESVLAHLIQLRDALLNNDERLITATGEWLERDLERVASVRASTGVRANRIENELQRTQDRQLQTESLLSDIADTDFAAAASRFSLLQMTLQANLQASSSLMQLSLLDFLR